MASVGGWELDLRTMTTYWSLETARIHEVHPPVAPAFDQAIRFFAAEAQPTILAAVQAAVDYATPWDLELPVVTAKGHRIWVRTQCSVVVEQGKAVKLLGALHDITERKRAEAALIETEARYRRIVNTAEEGIWMIDTGARTSFVNPKMAQLLGYTEEEMFGRDLIDFVDESARDVAYEIVLRRRPDISERHDFKFVRKDNSSLWGMVATNPIFDASGAYTGALTMITDITERKHAEGLLLESLAEKEALLREVHHRVKNNLQVINSLLRLEVGRLTNSDARSTLVAMQGRVQSMALLHETLYRAGTFAAVDLAVYLKQLVTQLNRALSINPGAIQIVFNLAPASIGMDQAVPCGLLVNELVSNALKHGFPGGRSGEIRIDLQVVDAGTKLRLVVSDTGIGLAADFELNRSRSLGLQLVSDLALQLGGELEIGPPPAAVFIVTFTAG
jgi:PAS domain S-box-containing protein